MRCEVGKKEDKQVSSFLRNKLSETMVTALSVRRWKSARSKVQQSKNFIKNDETDFVDWGGKELTWARP